MNKLRQDLKNAVEKDTILYVSIILMVIIQSILIILCVPSLEFPDFFGPKGHYVKIYNNRNREVYFTILGLFKPIIQRTGSFPHNISLNPQAGYFLWQPQWIPADRVWVQVMLYQVINLFLILFSVFLFKFLIQRDKKLQDNEKNWLTRIGFMYFLCPASAYALMGITPDIIIYLFQPFLFYMLYKRKYIVAIMVSLLLYLMADKSGLICALFVGILWCVDRLSVVCKEKKNVIIFLCALLIMFVIIRGFVDIIPDFHPYVSIMKKSITNNGRLLTKYLTLFMTSFCLWGTGNYATFPLFYLIYGYAIIKLVLKMIKEKEQDDINLMSFSVVITVIGLIIIFPGYCHIRYYMLLIIMILCLVWKYLFSDRYISCNRKYFVSCLILFLHNALLAVSIGIYTFVIL